jgi:integrase
MTYTIKINWEFMLMKLQEALHVFLGRFTHPETFRAYTNALQPLVTAIGPGRDVDIITPIDIQRYVNDLRHRRVKYENHPNRHPEYETLSPATIKKIVKAIRTFFNWLMELDLIEKNPVKKLPKIGEPDEPRVATTEEIEQLIRAAYGEPLLYAAMLFFVDTAARREGVATLRMSKLNIEKHCAVVDEKFDKSRTVWFGDECALALKKYIARRPAVRHDYVFCIRRKPYRPFNIDAFGQLIYRLAQRAEIPGPFHPHAIRRWRLDGLKRHTDDVTRALIAGHADDGETLRRHYTFADENEARAVVMSTAWGAKPQQSESGWKNVIKFTDLTG